MLNSVFVQANSGTVDGPVTSFIASFTRPVTVGNCIAILFRFTVNGPLSLAYSDTVGTNYGHGSQEIGVPISCFFAVAGGSGANTITVDQTFAGTVMTDIAWAVLEYTNPILFFGFTVQDFGKQFPGVQFALDSGDGSVGSILGANSLWEPNTQYTANDSSSFLEIVDNGTPPHIQGVFVSGKSGSVEPNPWDHSGGITNDNPPLEWIDSTVPAADFYIPVLAVGSSPFSEFTPLTGGDAWILRTQASSPGHCGITVYDLEAQPYISQVQATATKTVDNYELDMLLFNFQSNAPLSPGPPPVTKFRLDPRGLPIQSLPFCVNIRQKRFF